MNPVRVFANGFRSRSFTGSLFHETTGTQSRISLNFVYEFLIGSTIDWYNESNELCGISHQFIVGRFLLPALIRVKVCNLYMRSFPTCYAKTLEWQLYKSIKLTLEMLSIQFYKWAAKITKCTYPANSGRLCLIMEGVNIGSPEHRLPPTIGEKSGVTWAGSRRLPASQVRD